MPTLSRPRRHAMIDKQDVSAIARDLWVRAPSAATRFHAAVGYGQRPSLACCAFAASWMPVRRLRVAAPISGGCSR